MPNALTNSFAMRKADFMLRVIGLVAVVLSTLLPANAFGANKYGKRSARGCSSATVPNANRLALLRWYGANTAATFSVGGNPIGMVFDGSSMWVVNFGTNSVSKIRTSDGAVLGVFPVGKFPGYAAFDGANVWVTNIGDNTVSKLRARDGANLGTFATGTDPWGIAFDGTSIWVGNILDSTVSKFRPERWRGSGGLPFRTFSHQHGL